MELQFFEDDENFDKKFNMYEINGNAQTNQDGTDETERPIIKNNHGELDGDDERQLSNEYLEYEYDRIRITGALVIRLSMIQRQPEYWRARPENDTEHTQMLGEVCQDLAEEYLPELDIAKVRSMVDLHDKVEIFAGDVSTYNASKEELERKDAQEDKAMEELMPLLPMKKQKLLKEYKEQKSPESRFVRLVDKLMPYLVDDLGEGVKVLTVNHGVKSLSRYVYDDLIYAAKLKEQYPEPELEFLHVIRDISSSKVAKELKKYFDETDDPDDDDLNEDERREKEFDQLKELMEEPGVDFFG